MVLWEYCAQTVLQCMLECTLPLKPVLRGMVNVAFSSISHVHSGNLNPLFVNFVRSLTSKGSPFQITVFEPCHEINVLFVLHKLILQTCMRSQRVGLHVWVLVWPFVYFNTSCLRTAKALARLRSCAGSHEPSLVACNKYHNLISWPIYSNKCPGERCNHWSWKWRS